jgi:FkbH-like protein
MYYKPSDFPTLIEIERALKHLPMGRTPLKISILRNITVEAIEPYLLYLAADIGYNGEIRIGGYDQILQDATLPPKGFLNKETDVVLVFASIAVLSPLLDTGFASLNNADVAEELERVENYIRSVIQGVREHTNAPILWFGIESPTYACLGIADDQQEGQISSIQTLNIRLKRNLRAVHAAYFVNTDRCLARLGVRQYYDIRYWHLARAPYSRTAMAELAQEAFKFIRAFQGLNKKCLVLDCDNTLWGGILGEDGHSGIQIGSDYPGSAYQDFQKELLALYQRGVILALCSKNNEEDVLEVIDQHPDMLLRRHHFSAWRINWNDKATNLRELAAELNIGIDSLVFVDDSEFETSLVRENLPQVEVVLLPVDRPAEYRWLIAASGFFDTPALTQEDKQRSLLYQLERSRKVVRAEATDLEGYLRKLAIEIQICQLDKTVVARVAQQTQKTNQFNLTTRRYSEADIARMIDEPDSEVYFLRASDKFGDMGVVGSSICKCYKDEAIVDTFLLSCRALGRGIEARFLEEILYLLAERGIKKVFGHYIATQKNSQVADFYSQNGFNLCEPKSEEGCWFLRELLQLGERGLAHFSSVASPLGQISLDSKC